MIRNRLLSAAGLLSVLGFVAGGCGDNDLQTPDGADGVGGLTGGSGGLGVGGDSGDCPTGQLECNSECVNPKIDSRHCGACNVACNAGEVCVGSACEPSECPSGQIRCGAQCVTLSTSRDNCGACGNSCAASELCVSGTCAASCGPGVIACGGSCVNPSTDPDYCGATSCEPDGNPGVKCGELEACVVGECREYIRVWNPGTRVDTRATAVGEEQSIATDASGNAILFWRQLIDPSDTVGNSFRGFASFYDASTKTWSEAVQLDTNAARIRNLKVAMSPSGDGVAVWVAGPSAGQDVATTPSQVRAAVFDGTTRTWGNVVRLDVEVGAADTPDVALDGDGDALVAWAQNQNGISRVYVDRLVNGAFVGAQALPTQGLGQSQFPQVAVNDAGQMSVVWEELLGNVDVWVPFVSRYTGTWTAPEDMRSDAGILEGAWGRSPDVGIDSAGNITVVFIQDNLADRSILSAVYTESSGVWGAPLPAESLSAPVTTPQLSVDRNGLATLVFQAAEYAPSGDPTNFGDIYAARRSAAGDWATQVRLAVLAPSASELANPQARADQRGNAFAFWVRGNEAFTSRFGAVSGLWVGPEEIGTDEATSVVSPELAVSPGGNAFASWVESQGTAPPHVFVSRFD